MTLQPETERAIRDELAKGNYAGVDDLILRALQLLRQASSETEQGLPYGRMTPEQAAIAIRELRKGLRLNGISIKELINEGRE